MASTALIFLCYDFLGALVVGRPEQKCIDFFTSEQNGHLIISCFNVEDDWICSCNQIKWYFCSRQRWGITFLKVFFVFSLLSCGVIGQWLFFKIARSNSILIKNSRLRRQSRSLPKMQSWWGWAITSLTFEVVTWNKWHESQVCPLPWKMWKVHNTHH